MNFRPTPLLICLLAAALALLAARDLADRHTPAPLVIGYALALYTALHQCLIPFTTTADDQNGDHHRG